MKDKNKKKPVAPRDRGIKIELNGDFPIEENTCKETLKKDLLYGQVESYENKGVLISYEEGRQSKEIRHTIENNFLNFSKNILFGKKFNKKKNQEEVTIIYMRLIPKDLRNIEIENLALKLNYFPLVELKIRTK